MKKNKKWKIKVEKGAFDKVPKKDRELIMREFIRQVQSGEILKNAEPVDLDELRHENPGAYRAIVKWNKEHKND